MVRISRTERYRSLGNSFQVDVDTVVAYHLSVLKDMFPHVITLFTGIGGAEVALSGLNRNILNSQEFD